MSDSNTHPTFDVEEFLATMTDTYNNFVAEKDWVTSVSKDDKILALTTKLDSLELKLARANLPNRQSNQGGSNKTNTTNGNFLPVAEWRKKRGEEDKVERDGKTWYWCPYHKSEERGHPDGLYVTHTIDRCYVKKRQEQRRQREQQQSNTISSSAGDATTNPSSTLVKCPD